jgi:hypothetical protein
MSNERIEELEAQIAELKRRWPAHSVPPTLLQQLDDLEEELERALADEIGPRKTPGDCGCGLAQPDAIRSER